VAVGVLGFDQVLGADAGGQVAEPCLSYLRQFLLGADFWLFAGLAHGRPP
jgi:hypothetical protein